MYQLALDESNSRAGHLKKSLTYRKFIKGSDPICSKPINSLIECLLDLVFLKIDIHCLHNFGQKIGLVCKLNMSVEAAFWPLKRKVSNNYFNLIRKDWMLVY